MSTQESGRNEIAAVVTAALGGLALSSSPSLTASSSPSSSSPSSSSSPASLSSASFLFLQAMRAIRANNLRSAHHRLSLCVEELTWQQQQLQHGQQRQQQLHHGQQRQQHGLNACNHVEAEAGRCSHSSAASASALLLAPQVEGRAAAAAATAGRLAPAAGEADASAAPRRCPFAGGGAAVASAASASSRVVVASGEAAASERRCPFAGMARTGIPLPASACIRADGDAATSTASAAPSNAAVDGTGASTVTADESSVFDTAAAEASSAGALGSAAQGTHKCPVSSRSVDGSEMANDHAWQHQTACAAVQPLDLGASVGSDSSSGSSGNSSSRRQRSDERAVVCQLGAALGSLGDCCCMMGRTDEACERYTAAITTLEAFLFASPCVDSEAEHLAPSKADDLHHHDKASGQLKADQNLPFDSELLHSLTVTLNKLGDVHYRADNPSRALPLYRRTLHLRQQQLRYLQQRRGQQPGEKQHQEQQQQQQQQEVDEEKEQLHRLQLQLDLAVALAKVTDAKAAVTELTQQTRQQQQQTLQEEQQQPQQEQQQGVNGLKNEEGVKPILPCSTSPSVSSQSSPSPPTTADCKHVGTCVSAAADADATTHRIGNVTSSSCVGAAQNATVLGAEADSGMVTEAAAEAASWDAEAETFAEALKVAEAVQIPTGQSAPTSSAAFAQLAAKRANVIAMLRARLQ